MNQVNFLPKSYYEQRKHRWVSLRQSMMIFLIVGGIVGWYAHAQHQNAGMTAYARTITLQAEAMHREAAEARILAAQESTLSREVRIQHELAPAIDHTQVLTALAAAMPPSLVAHDISILCRKPVVQPVTDRKARPARSRTSEKVERDLMRIAVTGLAPDDAFVAEFVAALGKHPLFQNVKIVSSRPTEDGLLIGRQYRVEMEVAMDQDYRVTSLMPAPAVAVFSMPDQEVIHGP